MRSVSWATCRSSDLDRLYGRIDADGNRIDVLFANAGVGRVAPLGQITEEHLDLLLGTNLKGAVFTVQKALPLMNDNASIILTSSIWTVEGPEGFGVYSATKAALRSFARTWANELKAAVSGSTPSARAPSTRRVSPPRSTATPSRAGRSWTTWCPGFRSAGPAAGRRG